MSIPSNTTKKTAQVLIVEDSPTQAEQLRYLLESHHYVVMVAENGQKALLQVRKTRPAAIITDIVMPGMNGFELCRQLKEDDELNDIPVILLTHLTTSEDVLEGLAAGADSFITKPYSEDYLLANLQQILASQYLHQVERVRIGIEVSFGGRKRLITADQQQMLTLLISTYEAAIHRNDELIQSQHELKRLNERLEDRVEERTAALQVEVDERTQAEKRERLARNVLEVLNRPNQEGNTIGDILHLVKTTMDFEAVAIRLQKGEDFPYFESSGFPEEFLKAENTLCKKNGTGASSHDASGDPVLECMCGNVLCGKINVEAPFFSQGGSFWTNEASQLVSSTTVQNHPLFTRRRIYSEGYESIALIPLRSSGQIVGLLQINDHRPDRFSVEQIHFLEGLGASIGIALARKQAEEALRTSEAKFRGIVDNIGIGVMLIGRDMQVLEINRRMREWFHYSEQEFPEYCYGIFEDANSEDLCLDCPAQQTFATGKTHETTKKVTRENETRHYRLISSPLVNAEGKITAVIEMVEDVTEKLSLEEQLRQAQKMEAIGQLAGGVAHDFNNILQAIVGYGGMLRERLEGQEEALEFADEIVRGAERAAVLTRQLLAFSRRQVLKMEDLNINAIAQDLTKMIQRIIGENIEIKVIQEKNLGVVHADQGQMEQVLLNLCVNARDAMPQGGVLTIETDNISMDEAYCQAHAWSSPGQYVLLSVTDTGSGMDAQTQAHIFEPFFTTKEMGKGTGLGLATVYGIVNQHQGMIQVYSEVDKGTTFKIYMPSFSSASEVETTQEKPAIKGGTETILLAEDDETVCKFAERILKDAGYTVLLASNGEEAVEVYNQNRSRIDLVILDIIMPKMSGESVYEVLHPKAPELCFLFSSGYSNNATHTNFILRTGADLLQKPYAPDALLQKVRRALERNREVKGVFSVTHTEKEKKLT